MRIRAYSCCLAIVVLFVSLPGSAGLWTGWEWLNPRPQGHWLGGIAASDSLVVAVGSGGILVSEDADDWELVLSGVFLHDVIWAGDQFVAVGRSGIIMTSSDGRDWTVRHYSNIGYLNRVIFNGQLFLAVGVSGMTATSPDGISWTDHVVEQPYPNAMRDVAWNGSTFVTVGGPNVFGGTMAIYYSEDGAEWSMADIEDLLPREFFCIVWGHDRFLAFDALMGSILSSFDGQNWIEESTNLHGVFLEVLAVPGGYLGVGGGGQVFRSADGMSWTASTVLPLPRDLWDLTFFQDKYVAVGDDGAILVSADHGQQWDVVTTWEVDIHYSDEIVDLCWANGILIAISRNGGVFRSLNGLDWQLVTGFPTRLISVRWINEAFWVVGYDGLITTSEDGNVWNTRNSEDPVRYMDITTDGEVMVVVGARSSDQLDALVATSSDGYAWNEIEIDGGAGLIMKSITWAGTRFVGVGSGGSIFRSDDGFQWEFEILDSIGSMERVVSSGSSLVAVGSVDFLVSDDDGLTWQPTLVQTHASDVIWTGEMFLAVGGWIYSSRNGHDWITSPVGLGGLARHIASEGREIVFSGSWANLMRARLINILPPEEFVQEPVLD
ncbi:MAG: hypothetical protein ABFS37_14230 [Acidobacteriota bacterium]